MKWGGLIFAVRTLEREPPARSFALTLDILSQCGAAPRALADKRWCEVRDSDVLYPSIRHAGRAKRDPDARATDGQAIPEVPGLSRCDAISCRAVRPSWATLLSQPLMCR